MIFPEQGLQHLVGGGIKKGFRSSIQEKVKKSLFWKQL